MPGSMRTPRPATTAVASTRRRRADRDLSIVTLQGDGRGGEIDFNLLGTFFIPQIQLTVKSPSFYRVRVRVLRTAARCAYDLWDAREAMMTGWRARVRGRR